MAATEEAERSAASELLPLQNWQRPFLLRTVGTEDEYEAIDNEDVKCEYIDGLLIMHSPATLDHEYVTVFVSMLFGDHVSRHHLGRVLGSNAVMQLGQNRFSPDVSFLANNGETRVRGGRVIGPMDLVVEVLSPSTRGYDRGEKLQAYQDGRVPEILLIDPDERTFCAHVLGGSRYSAQTLTSGLYVSKSIVDLSLLVDWLWQRPLPSLDECRTQISQHT